MVDIVKKIVFIRRRWSCSKKIQNQKIKDLFDNLSKMAETIFYIFCISDYYTTTKLKSIESNSNEQRYYVLRYLTILRYLSTNFSSAR